jgi:hypothetical protein
MSSVAPDTLSETKRDADAFRARKLALGPDHTLGHIILPVGWSGTRVYLEDWPSVLTKIVVILRQTETKNGGLIWKIPMAFGVSHKSTRV